MRRILWLTGVVILMLLVTAACRGRRSAPEAERLEFDARGRVTRRTTPNGNKLEYRYNHDGRLVSISAPLRTDFRYNGVGDLIAVQNVSGTIEFRPDAFGRVAKVVATNGKELTYEYDPWGRIASLAVSGGARVRYERDLLGRLTAVDDTRGRTTYAYLDRQVVRELPNGVQTVWSFSLGGAVTSIVHRRVSGEPISAFDYSYRPDGRVDSVHEVTRGGEVRTHYEYDLLGRLIAARASDGQSETYGYDAVGNRTTERSATGDVRLEYDAHGRLVKRGPFVYNYDNAGNVTGRLDTRDGSKITYEYDADGRLLNVHGKTAVHYGYDGLGNRVTREVGVERRAYLNDVNSGIAQPVAVFDGGGRLQAQYVLADSRIGERRADGTTLYYLADRNGSVRAVVDDRGEIVREQRYTPFGRPLGAAAQDVEFYGFDGEPWDRDAELIFLRRRFYDPAVGRMIGADPRRGHLTDPRTLNRYAFAANDPINRWDPTGLQDGDITASSFTPPVIDSGGTATSASWSQSFVDSGGGPSVQFQTPASDAPSFVGTVRDAVSTLLGSPAQSVTSLTNLASNVAPRIENAIVAAVPRMASEGTQTNLRTSLAIADVDAALAGRAAGKFSATVGSAVAGYDWYNARGSEANSEAAVDFFKSVGWSGVGAAAEAGGGGLPAAIGASIGSAAKTINGAIAQAEGIPKSIADGQFNYATQTPFRLVGDAASFLGSGAGRSTAQAAFQAALDTVGGNPLAADGISWSASGGQPVGGVRFDRDTELIGKLGAISGAAFDPKTGRVVLVGEKRTTLPPMRLDDLAVALRIAYAPIAEDPSMTIDPDPRNPRGPTMNVVFFAGTANTHFGWVMFEADRAMKGYSAGKDNVTKQLVDLPIRGYCNVVGLDMYRILAQRPAGGNHQANWSRACEPTAPNNLLQPYYRDLWSRYWLVPDRVFLNVSADGTRIAFGETKMRVCTETMRLVGGKMVSMNAYNPNDGRSECDRPKAVRDEAAEYFAQHFTEHYEEYAAHNPIYGELKRLAQVYAVARWMKAARVPIDAELVDALAATAYPTPTTTPSVSNAGVIKAKVAGGTESLTIGIFGGVKMSLKIDYRQGARTSALSKALPADSRQTTELSVEGKPQIAVAAFSRTPPDYGSFQTTTTDAAVGAPNGPTLVLRRSYTSFHAGPSEFGRSWTLLMPRLHFVRHATAAGADNGTKDVNGARRIDRVGLAGRPDTIVTVQDFQMSNDFATVDDRFVGHFIDSEWQRIGFKSTRASTPYRGLYPNQDGTFSLLYSNGNEWRFGADGLLRQIRTATTVIDYRYDAESRQLREVSSGSTWIRLHYDGGRINRVDENSGAVVRYGYDANGDLSRVERGASTTTYEYDQQHQLVRQTVDGVESFRNEYDVRGRLVRQLDVQGHVIGQRKVEATADGGRRIAETVAGETTTSTYDKNLRPVEVRTSDATFKYGYYASGAPKTVEVTYIDNRKAILELSEDRRNLRGTDLRGTDFRLSYDERGALAATTINGAPYVSYSRDRVGRIIAADYGSVREQYVYDADGRVSRYVVQPTATARAEEMQLAYDAQGRLARVVGSGFTPIEVRRSDPAGTQISVGRAAFRIAVDADRRVVEAHGPEDRLVAYRYAPDGNLAQVALQVGPHAARWEFENGRLRSVNDLGGGRMGYEYNAQGRLVGVTDSYGKTTRYAYDTRGRLISVVLADGRQIGYTYDENRRSIEVIPTKMR